MAKKRKRKLPAPRTILGKIDRGTEETRAKLTRPPWAFWPEAHRYAAAAAEIDWAFRLICEGMMSGAAKLLADAPGYCDGWTPDQRAAVDRYRRWQKALRPRELVGLAIDVIVDGHQCVNGAEANLKCALGNYLVLFPVPIDNRARKI